MSRNASVMIIFITGILGLTAAAAGVGHAVSTTPTPTPVPYRAIEIEVLTEPDPDDLFEIGEIFEGRDHEGFLIWTHQSHFWQPGDFFDAGSLTVRVIFDHTLAVEPFVFWRSSGLQNVYDADNNVIGRYLFAGMNISVSTAQLDLGEHTLTVQAQTPHDETFSQNWQFVIRERAIPRLETPPDIAPTTDYLQQFPLPTPAYLRNVATTAKSLDQFSPLGSGEGVCFTLADEPFVPAELIDNPFRPAQWEDFTLLVDNTVLTDDQFGGRWSDSPGVLFLCFDTDFLAAGTHLAELRITAHGEPYAFQWAFVIE